MHSNTEYGRLCLDSEEEPEPKSWRPRQILLGARLPPPSSGRPPGSRPTLPRRCRARVEGPRFGTRPTDRSETRSRRRADEGSGEAHLDEALGVVEQAQGRVAAGVWPQGHHLLQLVQAVA